jgi:hypothetical protein
MRLPRVRFTIRHLMLAVAVVASSLFLLRTLGGPLFAFVLAALMLAFASWLPARARLKRPALWFAISAIVTNGGVAVLCVYFRNMVGMLGMALGSFYGISVVLGLGVTWAAEATRRDANPRRSPLVAWASVLALSIAPLTMTVTSWPFRLAFLISRPALDRLANQVAAGKALRRAEWAGLYLVFDTDLDARSGNIGLIIRQDPSGRSGFVRLGPGTPPNHYGPLFNLDIDEHIGGRWQFQEED